MLNKTDKTDTISYAAKKNQRRNKKYCTIMSCNKAFIL